MAATLATLHRSLASLSDTDLPPVAALVANPNDRLRDGQIIHGDFAAANLILTPSGLRVIDFDECGWGSIEFELGNSLYLELFDAWRAGSLDRYHRFRSSFVDAYREAAAAEVDEDLVDEAIRVRASALARWLSTPADAPVGIRTASAAWRKRLHSFIDDVPSLTRPSNRRRQ